MPPGAPPRYLKTFNNENFFMKLMARFNEFLEHKEKPVLETPNVLRSEVQRPLSIQSVDRNGVKVVHDMELLAQYNELQKIDIQELYSEFIANIHGEFADFIQIHHSDFLEEYEGMSIHADGEPYFEVERPKRVFAKIWERGTSTTFQHDSDNFLFGIIVRGFKDTSKSLSQALENRWRQDQAEDEGEDFY